MQKIDDTYANAYAAWIEMGGPDALEPNLVNILESASSLIKEPYLFI